MASQEQPRGMENMGVTCYLNSAMQALAACPALVQHMHHSKQVLELASSSSASKRNHKSDLAAAFARVLEQLFMKGGGPSAPPIRTVELVDAAQGLNHAQVGQPGVPVRQPAAEDA